MLKKICLLGLHINKYLSFQEEPIVLVEEKSCPVYDTDNEEEESMPVYDTDIEDVVEEEEGFVGKGGFGGEEDNIEDIVVVANDICSSMIQTTLSVDVEEDVNTKSHELMSFGIKILLSRSVVSSVSSPNELKSRPLANGDSMPLAGIGSVDTPSVALSDVYYIPSLTMNLAYVSKICDSGCDVNFFVSDCFIYDRQTQDLVGTGHRQGEIYVLEHFRDINDTTSCSVDLSSFWLNHSSSAIYLWHSRLGHVSGSRLRSLASTGALGKLDVHDKLAKFSALPFSNSVSSSNAPLDIVHFDVWGPSPRRSDFLTVFKEFRALLTTQHLTVIKCFRCDLGGEYTSNEFVGLLKSDGTIYQTSCTNTSQQNGVAERKHHHLVEMARSFLLYVDVPSVFWEEAVLTATYFVASIHRLHEPESYKEVVCEPLWQVAMDEELAALHQTQTWDLVRLLIGKRAIGSRWVYNIKTKSDGSVKRYKARRVAKGYAQEYGMDYEETFAPVSKITTVRTLIAVASSRKWKIFQLDVKNAILNGDLNEEGFMKPPPDVSHKPGEVCKLKKALYGLKQAPRLLRYFLGIETASSPKGCLLSRSKYIGDLLDRARITDKMVEDISIDAKAKYTPTDGDPLPGLSLYRTIVGNLVYLTFTRPDISYAVHIVSQFVSAHWAVVLHILMYLLGTQSTTGFCIFLGDSLISWKSKKQDVLSKSSTKVDCRAMTVTTSEIVWLRWLLADMGVCIRHSTLLHCDNRNVIQIACNSMFHERTKHIEIDCHCTRHHLQAVTISLPFLPSALQIADVFTKETTGLSFEKIELKILLQAMENMLNYAIIVLDPYELDRSMAIANVIYGLFG
ncbi:putative mitochondrial protein [Tanacetum coccineum]